MSDDRDEEINEPGIRARGAEVARSILDVMEAFRDELSVAEVELCLAAVSGLIGFSGRNQGDESMSDVPEYVERGINPGVRRLVAYLNARGFRTVDSGDGATRDYECDREEPYVAMVVMAAEGNPAALVTEAQRLRDEMTEIGVELVAVGHGKGYAQASYDPVDDTAILELVGITDADCDWTDEVDSVAFMGAMVSLATGRGANGEP